MSNVRHSAKKLRRAYTLIIVIVTSFIVIAFATVMSTFVLHEWRRDGRAVLEAHAEQVLASAKAWRASHHDAHLSADPMPLNVDGLLPTPYAAIVRLARVEVQNGKSVELCEVRIDGGYAHLTRRAAWPAFSNEARPSDPGQSLRGD